MYLCILVHSQWRIEPFSTVQCILYAAGCSIREYRSYFSPLCWHNMPAYYALKYAEILNGSLINRYKATMQL